MPRHGKAASEFSAEEIKAIELAGRALRRVVDHSRGVEKVEEQLQRLLMAVGRGGVGECLEGLGKQDSFVENGVTWRVAIRDKKRFMTSFGWITVERPLFRATRNGPTRCLVSECGGLFLDKWTPRAAKLAALATAELPFARAEALFRAAGAMAPSSTLLQRLDRDLLRLWEGDREAYEARLRRSCPIPKAAVTAVVSLDGVMVNMVGSDRAEKVARTRAEGRAPRGPSGYKEAAIGVVSLYDVAGERLATWRMGRMPEEDKVAVKGWIRAELAWIRKKRPDIRVVAAADGAASNWVFLESLEADLEVVDYYHTVEHLSRHISLANGASTLDTQAKIREAKRRLLEMPGGAERVFAALDRSRRAAGTLPSSLNKTTGKRQPTYYQRHRKRMNYLELREQHIPIGTGVTEGTCRHLVVDRLRRSGMTWSEPGGQAVMNLRALVVSNRFELGWDCLVEANRRRLRACA